MTLVQLRREIDRLDRDIVRLLNKRTKHALEIGRIKSEARIPIFVPGREHVVMDRLRGLNHGPLPDESLQHIYREIMSAARAIEGGLKIACTRASAAAARAKFGDSVEYVSKPTAEACRKAVGRRVQLAVLPVSGKQSNQIDGFSHDGKRYAVIAEQK